MAMSSGTSQSTVLDGRWSDERSPRRHMTADLTRDKWFVGCSMFKVQSLLLQGPDGITDTDDIYIKFIHGKQIKMIKIIIESVDSISRDEPDSPLTQYITNAGISLARYTITHFKHCVLWLISNRISSV